MATITLQATTINSAIVAAATALYDDLGGQVAPEPRVIRNGALSGGGRVGSSVNLDYFYDAWKSTDISVLALGAPASYWSFDMDAVRTIGRPRMIPIPGMASRIYLPSGVKSLRLSYATTAFATEPSTSSFMTGNAINAGMFALWVDGQIMPSTWQRVVSTYGQKYTKASSSTPDKYYADSRLSNVARVANTVVLTSGADAALLTEGYHNVSVRIYVANNHVRVRNRMLSWVYHR